MEDTPTSVTNCRVCEPAPLPGGILDQCTERNNWERRNTDLPDPSSRLSFCSVSNSETESVWINKSMAESPAFLTSSRQGLKEGSHGSAGPPTQMQSGGGRSHETRLGVQARRAGSTLGGAPLHRADVQLEANEEIKRCDERKAKVTFQHDTQCFLISLTAPRLRESREKHQRMV